MAKFRRTQAFTIIELTAVMVIIMILAGLIVSVGKSARQRAMKAKAESMIAALEVAIGMYNTDTGAYPTTDGGSGCQNLYDQLTNTAYASGPSAISGWRGPYMEFKDRDLDNPTSPSYIVDPWGNAYNYLMPGTATTNTNSFDLWSQGPDTTVTTDNITNW